MEFQDKKAYLDEIQTMVNGTGLGTQTAEERHTTLTELCVLSKNEEAPEIRTEAQKLFKLIVHRIETAASLQIGDTVKLTCLYKNLPKDLVGTVKAVCESEELTVCFKVQENLQVNIHVPRLLLDFSKN